MVEISQTLGFVSTDVAVRHKVVQKGFSTAVGYKYEVRLVRFHSEPVWPSGKALGW